MKTRPKKFAFILGGTLVFYWATYLLSVEVNYPEMKAVHVAVPHYRPWDSGLIRGIFAPAQLLDAEVLRPAHWHDKMEG